MTLLLMIRSTFKEWLPDNDLHVNFRSSELRVLLVRRPGNKMEPSPELASGSSRYECEVLLTKLRRQMVRQVGYAPTSPVWKTEILLLNDWRFQSGRWSCYRRSLSRSSGERTSIYAIQR